MQENFVKYNFPNFDVYYAKINTQYWPKNLGELYSKFPSPIWLFDPIPTCIKFS
jgi:hypothetical protein